MQAMGELVDRGLVRFIGVSNFDIDEMEEAQFFLSHYPIVSNQVRYNLNDRSIEMDLLPYCEEKDITILAYTPLDDGNLAKKPSLINSNKMNILDDISQETGKTMGQVAINWCTSRKKVIAIPKSNSQERTIENCESSGWRLSQKEINRLNEAF
jgi:diketogulonate reductase-like aldo/keto reductase